MVNPTNSFRERNLVLQLIYESQIKSKTVMSWSSQKKVHFCHAYFVRKKFFCLFLKSRKALKCILKDFFSKCDHSFLWIWSHLLKKSLMEKSISCAFLNWRWSQLSIKKQKKKSRSRRPDVFWKKYFIKLTRNRLCQSLLFYQVAGFRSATLLKIYSIGHRWFPLNFVNGCFYTLLEPGLNKLEVETMLKY